MKSFRNRTPTPSAPWHPDFRDREALPDVKAVRTSFFINGVSILLLVLVGYFLGFQEYKQRTLQSDINALEGKIAEHQSRNEEVLRLNRSFLTNQRLINEVADYLGDSLELSELLVALGESLHPNIALSSIRLQGGSQRDSAGERQILISGSIRAAPEAAASAITEYLNIFHENPFLNQRVTDAVSTSLVPTPEGDTMAFGIRMKVQNQAAKKEDSK